MADQAGFLAFLRGTAGIPTSALPDASPVIPAALNYALEIVNKTLGCVPVAIPGQNSLYDLAVYNLATDFLINWAPDNPPSDYFTCLRQKLGLNAFQAGVISETHDESTGMSMVVSKAFEDLTISNLQNLKTPFGQFYLGLAQSLGTLWGIT